ncbi:MAG: DNA repair and recombination protein RadB [Candidatus Altiarchaeota archaeon]
MIKLSQYPGVLDELLDGVLTQVYGPPNSGKSNLAIISSVAASKHGKVVYIDPEGGFSVERLKQIAGADYRTVLENILLIEPTTFDEQKVAIGKLDDIVVQDSVSLIVVDSVAMLYRLEEDITAKELAKFMASLLRIARKYTIPVLLTNQVYSDFETGKNRPIGGVINEYWGKVILEADIRPDGVRTLMLRKHLSRQTGVSMEYRIVSEGVKPLSTSCRMRVDQFE